MPTYTPEQESALNRVQAAFLPLRNYSNLSIKKYGNSLGAEGYLQSSMADLLMEDSSVPVMEKRLRVAITEARNVGVMVGMDRGLDELERLAFQGIN